jgi:DNA-binding NarL/FixJ family response regulator
MTELSPRQRQVADLLATGMSNKQIARRIGLAEGTVKFHVMRVFERVGANNRTEAALKLRGVTQ